MSQVNNPLTQSPGPNTQVDPVVHDNDFPAPAHPILELKPPIPEPIAHIPAEPDVVDEI
ncbi:hypothetical protein FRC06_008614, partial [Ceratobasidium sp. 370]